MHSIVNPHIFATSKTRPINFRVPARIYVTGATATGKSYWVQRLVEELPSFFNCTFETVYYVYPPSRSSTISDIRANHIRSLKASCDRHDISFRDISTDLNEFLASLEHSTAHRLVILDDLCQELFSISNGQEAFVKVIIDIFNKQLFH